MSNQTPLDTVTVLRELAALFDGVDNGYCTICHSHRLYDTKGNVQPCENDECLSHRISAALKQELSEREFFIQWLLVAHDTLARDGWEEGWSDEEVRSDLNRLLGNLGYSPHSKKGKTLRERKLRYAPPQTGKAEG